MSSREKPKVVCVRSFVPKREEVRDLADLVGHDRGARQLDHRADRDVDLDALLGHDLGDDLLALGTQHLELGLERHERDHDLGARVLAGLLELAGRLRDRAHLHGVELGEHDAEAAAAKAEHRVHLGHRVDLREQTALLGEVMARRRRRTRPSRSRPRARAASRGTRAAAGRAGGP